jgi:hypothetical protein
MMNKKFDEYGNYGENNPPIGVRPFTKEERERAKERQQMNTSTMTEEIVLHSAMKRNNLTLKEAVFAIERYANDKQFMEQLDRLYSNEVILDE